MKVSHCGLHYEASGPDTGDFGLVLVHGWACQPSDYERVIQQLTKERHASYRIVAVGLPGHGDTPKEVLPKPSMTGFAELVLALSRELGLKRIVAAGHSMGTRIVSEMSRLSMDASPNPTVAGVVFIDGSTYKLRDRLSIDKGDEKAKAAARAEVFESMFSSMTPPQFRQATLHHIATIDQTYSHQVREAQISFDHEGFETALQRVGKAAISLLNLPSSDTDSSRVPILSPDHRTKWMNYVKEHVPPVQEKVIIGSSHFPHVDLPDLVAKEVDEFVRELI